MQTLSSSSIPPYNSNVTIQLDTVEGLAENQLVVIPNAAYLVVTSINGVTNEATLNLIISIAAVGAVLPKGSQLFPSGVPQNLFSKSTQMSSDDTSYTTVLPTEFVLTNTTNNPQTVSVGSADPSATLSVYDYLGVAATNPVTLSGANFYALGSSTPVSSLILNTNFFLIRFRAVSGVGYFPY